MIKDLDITPQLPRAGKIRLGTKVKSAKGFEIPANTPHFIIRGDTPDERALLEMLGHAGKTVNFRGQQIPSGPTHIDVYLPYDRIDIVFPQARKLYTKSALVCVGDGETAKWKGDPGNRLQPPHTPNASGIIPCNKDCPYRTNDKCPCKPTGRLMVKPIGLERIFEVTVHDLGIRAVMNCIALLKSEYRGNIANIPLRLTKKEVEVQPKGQAKKKVLVPFLEPVPQQEMETQVKALIQAQEQKFAAFGEHRDLLFGGQEEQNAQLPAPNIDVDDEEQPEEETIVGEEDAEVLQPIVEEQPIENPQEMAEIFNTPAQPAPAPPVQQPIQQPPAPVTPPEVTPIKKNEVKNEVCSICNAPLQYRQGVTAAGKKWANYACPNGDLKDGHGRWSSYKEGVPDYAPRKTQDDPGF